MARWFSFTLSRTSSKVIKVIGQFQGHEKKTRAQQLVRWPTVATKKTWIKFTIGKKSSYSWRSISVFMPNSHHHSDTTRHNETVASRRVGRYELRIKARSQQMNWTELNSSLRTAANLWQWIVMAWIVCLLTYLWIRNWAECVVAWWLNSYVRRPAMRPAQRCGCRRWGAM